LIRALDPLEGIGEMLLRTNKKKLDHTLTRGPGNVSKALGILTKHSGCSLLDDRSLSSTMEEYTAKENLLLRRALVSITQEKMLYCHIVFM
jgi:DNA-3-methyladenine glycosylase